MILCVTGMMAAGKNFVSGIFEELGFKSVDADLLGHRAVDLCTPQIVQTFGGLASEKGIQITDYDGKIIRRNLGALIFGHDDLVKKQEDIVFPQIDQMFHEFMEQNKESDIILNATVLYKMPLIKKMDAVIFVDAPTIVRLFRAKKRDGMKFKQIFARFATQKNLFSKYSVSHADILRVWNVGSKNQVKKRVEKIILKLRNPMGNTKWNKNEHCGF